MRFKIIKPSSCFSGTPLAPFLEAWADELARSGLGSCWSASGGGKRRGGKRARNRVRRRSERDIVDTALASGAFETLAKALRAAGLVDVLKGEGLFTVFAPTDDAFARLPEGVLDELLADREKLRSVLTLHVVPGRFEASALSGVAAVRTVQGQTLEVDTALGLKVGVAYVVRPDIAASNGVIHAIDSVLIPA